MKENKQCRKTQAVQESRAVHVGMSVTVDELSRWESGI